MGRSSFKKRLAVAVTVALSLMFVLSIVPFSLIEAHVLAASNTDIINVPFANGPNGATTANTYTSNVTITVSGHGHASQSAESDAFYIYTDNSGNPITPEHHFDFGLCINQKPVENYVAVPPYRDDHTYQFTISVGDSPQKLTFGVCDTYTVDNTGAFTITVKGKDDSISTPATPTPTSAMQICTERLHLPESTCHVLTEEPNAVDKQQQIIKEILQGGGQAARDSVCDNKETRDILGLTSNPELERRICGNRNKN